MSFLKSKIFAVLGLMAVVWLSWSVARLWPKKITVENRVKSLEQRIAETEKSNSALAKLMAYFKSPAYLEREAKLKLNVRRSDENVVFIFQDEKEAVIKEEKNKSLPDLEGLTNFEKWIRYLFK